MNDKKLRNHLNKIREAQKIITIEINEIYNDNLNDVESVKE